MSALWGNGGRFERERVKLNHIIHTISQNMSYHNKLSYICFQFQTSLIRSFKITTRNSKVRSRINNTIHCLDTKLISWYLISQVSTIHIYYWPSFAEANGCNGTCHCETRFTQCVSAFVVTVRSNVRHINIQSNKLILIFFQKIIKNIDRTIVLKIPS